MDNAGENIKMQKYFEDNNFEDITVEFTLVDALEYNAVVERGFGSLYGRVQASLIGIGFWYK